MLDKLVLVLCNWYYYIFNRRYRLKYRIAQRKIKHARIILENDYLFRASTIDRGELLPEHSLALAILYNKERYLEERIAKYFSYERRTRISKRLIQTTT